MEKMERFQLAAPCLLGLEGLVGDELRKMGMEQVEPQNGRVLFTGGCEAIARANIGSRYAERIQILLGTFEARSFEELFQGVKGLPWEEWINREDAFPVKGRSLNSQLSSIPDCQSIIKKAIVERMKAKYNLPWFEETGPVHQIQFLIMKDKVSLMLDTSGAGLHKRGYRANATEAPIKETLAASMAYLAHVRGDSVLYDPFCGSGTILIESALLALNIAPGLRRRFASERWGQIPERVWKEERERAMSTIHMERGFIAYGSDIDERALRLSEENARKAGIPGRVKLNRKELCEFSPETKNGIVICNPPYGERLLDVQHAEELYREMGKVFTRKPGWSYAVISPDDTFESCFGRKADRRRKLYNGMIKCQLYMYFK